VDLARRYPNERLVVVTHGAVSNAVLTERSGGTLRWGTANLHTACVSVLHLRGETWEIESHNAIAHLMDAPPHALPTA
jgi:broad specificity phosphatase PhoE